MKSVIIFMSGVLILAMSSLATAANPIDQAVERGVAFLKNLHKNGINQANNTYEGGQIILAGLAMIEGGVPISDPVIVNITKFVREQSFTMNKTYQTSLAIMYLDRVGDPKDIPLIQMMGVRLVVGQSPGGGWTYNAVPTVTGEAAEYLRTKITDGRELAVKDGRPEVHPEVIVYAKALNDPQAFPNAGPRANDDNSNTQFAAIAVWIAHRNGVPCENSFARLDQRFRSSQNPQTGSWGYSADMSGINGSRSMTCAGLIGLAVGHGYVNEARAKNSRLFQGHPGLTKDPVVRAGIIFLANGIANPNPNGMLMPMPIIQGMGPPPLDYYFLWSVERVGMAYGIEKMGPIDWYAWGSNQILRNQSNDGSWRGMYGAEVDTSLALLFLLRANFAKDLSKALRGRLGGSELRSGPVDPEKFTTNNTPMNKTPIREPNDPLLPKVEPRIPEPIGNDDGRALAKQLVTASGEPFVALLAKLRDGKGASYTEALTSSIDQLEGDAQKQARDALARRLARMTAETLSELLRHSNREIRRAAALACAMKDDKSHIGELINCLADTDPIVARAVKAALVSLSGKDFGPTPDATPIARAKAIADWRAWHKSQK